MSFLNKLGDEIDKVTKPVYKATLEPTLGKYGEGGKDAAATFDDKAGRQAAEAAGIDWGKGGENIIPEKKLLDHVADTATGKK